MPRAGLEVHQRRSLDGSVCAAAVSTGTALSADEAAGRRGDTSAAKVKDHLKKRNFGSLTKEEKKQVLCCLVQVPVQVLVGVRGAARRACVIGDSF